MAKLTLQEDREAAAHREVGVTRVSRGVAWVLSVFFVLLIALIPLFQWVRDHRDFRAGERPDPYPQAAEIFRAWPGALRAAVEEEGGPWPAFLAANRYLLRAIGEFEDELEDHSFLGKIIRPRMQSLLIELGVGNEQAYVGREGWLFYRPGVDYVSGPGFLERNQLDRRRFEIDARGDPVRPNPLPALRDFHRQLKQNGITLVLVPTPVKPTVHPEKLSPGLAGHGFPNNASYGRFLQKIRESGIHVFDPLDLMADLRLQGNGHPLYLRTDTHWTPATMQKVAIGLAEWIQDETELPEGPEGGTRVSEVEWEALGDITRMLQLSPGQRHFPPERVRLKQVLTGEGGSWRSDSEAPVLVLGDSFSNIFSVEAMGWGESAGFVEHLSHALGMPVDRITRNDNASFATREILANELARGRDRLAGKKIVVYQFAARELSLGNWKKTSLVLGEPAETDFLALETGERLEVEATVHAVSSTPRPGTVPYSDHIVSLHLVDIAAADGSFEDGQAVVYAWSMRDNQLEPAARLRRGDRVRFVLRPWFELADRYDAINRSEPRDFELQLVDPLWMESLDIEGGP